MCIRDSVYPGSQTGNPGNPMYGHMINDWASGEYYKMVFDKNLNENSESIIYSTTIQSIEE